MGRGVGGRRVGRNPRVPPPPPALWEGDAARRTVRSLHPSPLSPLKQKGGAQRGAFLSCPRRLLPAV